MVHGHHDRYLIPNMRCQRLNVIYYCSRDYNESWGGHLFLYDKLLYNLVKITPLFNRLLIFDTGRYSYHGHPDPLRSPNTARRNSLAAYYYVKSRSHDSTYRGFQSIRWVPTSPSDLFIGYFCHKFKSIIRNFLIDN